MCIHVAQHARRNADAGGNHGGGHKHRLMRGFVMPSQEEKAHGEGQDDSGNGNPQAEPSHADQIAGRSFQSDGEEQEYGADFGDGVDRVAGQNKAGGVGAEHHASQDLAEHRRKVQPLKQLTKHLRPDEDGKQLQQK